jgi:hypothetical protein
MFVMYDTHLARLQKPPPGSRTAVPVISLGLRCPAPGSCTGTEEGVERENEGADFAGSERTKSSLARVKTYDGEATPSNIKVIGFGPCM